MATSQTCKSALESAIPFSLVYCQDGASQALARISAEGRSVVGAEVEMVILER